MATQSVPDQVLEELFSDGTVQYELVDGALLAKPMNSIFHSLLLSWLAKLLNETAGDEFYVLADPLSKIRDDHWRRPDIAVIHADDAEPWKYVMPGHWPLLCVEIVSVPEQSSEEMLDKCMLNHEQGVKYCWVVEPESRTAWTYHLGQSRTWVPTEAGILDAGHIRIPVKEVWRGLKNKRGSRLR